MTLEIEARRRVHTVSCRLYEILGHANEPRVTASRWVAACGLGVGKWRRGSHRAKRKFGEVMDMFTALIVVMTLQIAHFQYVHMYVSKALFQRELTQC